MEVSIFVATVVTRSKHQRVRDDAERDEMIEQAMQDQLRECFAQPVLLGEAVQALECKELLAALDDEDGVLRSIRIENLL